MSAADPAASSPTDEQKVYSSCLTAGSAAHVFSIVGQDLECRGVFSNLLLFARFQFIVFYNDAFPWTVALKNPYQSKNDYGNIQFICSRKVSSFPLDQQELAQMHLQYTESYL